MKKHTKHLLAGIIFLISLLLYIFTLAPGLMFTDSGELAGAVLTLGVPHPTGYPLFIILANLFSQLPISANPIYELNLFSAVCISAASVVFYYLILELFFLLKQRENPIVSKKESSKRQKAFANTKTSDEQPKVLQLIDYITAFIASLIFVTARTIWENAAMLEVYPLQILLFVLTIYIFLKSLANSNNQKKYLLLLAFVLGLGFANHLTTLLIMPMVLIAYFMFYHQSFQSLKEKLKFLISLSIPFIIGLSPYIFIIISSSMEPVFNWGGISRGFDKFIYHVSGKQFQVWMFTGEGIGENFIKFIELLPYQAGLVGLVLFVWGIVELSRLRRKLTAALIIAFFSAALYSINYSIHDIDSYFSLAFIIMLIFTAVGLLKIAEKMSNYYYLLVLIPIFSAYINYDPADKSNNNLVNTYTETVFKGIEKNAVVISAQWDYLVSAFWYKQKIEGFRNDVDLIEKELLRRTWYLQQLAKWSPDAVKNSQRETKDYLEYLERFESGEKFTDYDNMTIQRRYLDLLYSYIDNNIKYRPVYITLEALQSDPEIANKYSLEPQGLAVQIKEKADSGIYNYKELNLDELASSFDKLKNSEKYNHLISGLKEYSINFYLNVSVRYLAETKRYDYALKALNEIKKIAPAHPNIESIKNNIEKQSGK